MLNTNISQLRVGVMTEVVAHFFMAVPTQVEPVDINVGESYFIYDDDGNATEVTCTDVTNEHSKYQSKNGGLHLVPNIEPELNAFEFNRLLSAIFTPSDEREGYEQFVINRAIAVKVIEKTDTGSYEFTEHGNNLSKVHFMGSNLKAIDN